MFSTVDSKLVLVFSLFWFCFCKNSLFSDVMDLFLCFTVWRLKSIFWGSFLVVQWLGVPALTAKDVGSIFAQGTKILKVEWPIIINNNKDILLESFRWREKFEIALGRIVIATQK